MTNAPRCVCFFLLILPLTACGGQTLAPVSEHSTGIRYPESEYREVRAGDTLYSIAWESGRDYRTLAEWNDLPPPYIIKAGQKLRLFPPTKVKTAAPTAAARTPPSKATPPRRAPVPASAPVTAPAKSPVVAKAEPASKHALPVTKPTPKKMTWAWPTEGKILSRYAASGSNKGIDIGGRKGQPIGAAAAGQVVYQGSGLRGYGKLIIVKHDADFLSAYAHCDKVFVSEGNMIKRGQKIAEMGNSGTEQVKLHFEIRYRGAPVDPQNYLPRK